MKWKQNRYAVNSQITQRPRKLSGTKEELCLIVLDADEKKRVFKSEILKIFPEGAKHLPDELQPRGIYPIVKNGTQKVQYIGKAEKLGFNFALFRALF